MGTLLTTDLRRLPEPALARSACAMLWPVVPRCSSSGAANTPGGKGKTFGWSQNTSASDSMRIKFFGNQKNQSGHAEAARPSAVTARRS